MKPLHIESQPNLIPATDDDLGAKTPDSKDVISCTWNEKKSTLLGKMGKTMYGNWVNYPFENKQTIVVGRNANCDIVVAQPYISAKHFQISKKTTVFSLLIATAMQEHT